MISLAPQVKAQVLQYQEKSLQAPVKIQTLFKRLDRFIHWQKEEGEMLIAQVPWCAQPGRTCSALMFSLFWDGILQEH